MKVEVSTNKIRTTGSKYHFLGDFYKESAILKNDVILMSRKSDFWFLRIFLLLTFKRASGARMGLLVSP